MGGARLPSSRRALNSRCAQARCTRSRPHPPLLAGKMHPFTGEVDVVTSPVFDEATGARAVLGELPKMSEAEALEAVQAAARAWDRGLGAWPQMKLADRIAAIEATVAELRLLRPQIVNTLMHIINYGLGSNYMVLYYYGSDCCGHNSSTRSCAGARRRRWRQTRGIRTDDIGHRTSPNTNPPGIRMRERPALPHLRAVEVVRGSRRVWRASRRAPPQMGY